MNNIVNIYNDDSVRLAVKSRDIRQRVGNAIAKAYRGMSWHIDVNLAGGIVTITSPKISVKYGMILHLTRDLMDLEVRAVRLAGELLERFRVSRETGDATHLKRNVAGEALGVKRGEQ